jgi:hypothetical protein
LNETIMQKMSLKIHDGLLNFEALV